MRPAWIETARQCLCDKRHSEGGWSYSRATRPAIEATALVGLSLLPTDPGISQEAASWLGSVQRRDGSLGVTRTLIEPGWPTSYACLLWAALGGCAAAQSAAVSWLLAQKGETAPNTERWPLGHDMRLVGWPWVAGTHSWVEPTSLAILALSRTEKFDDARSREGLSLLCDRAIPTGGWNMGNPIVFGTPLRALPAPTGLALLALAAADKPVPAIGPAIRFLQHALSQTLAPVSLGWGLLGLRAWGAEPRGSAEWLARSYDRTQVRPANSVALAMLLLAARAESLGSLGITRSESMIAHE